MISPKCLDHLFEVSNQKLIYFLKCNSNRSCFNLDGVALVIKFLLYLLSHKDQNLASLQVEKHSS